MPTEQSDCYTTWSLKQTGFEVPSYPLSYPTKVMTLPFRLSPLRLPHSAHVHTRLLALTPSALVVSAMFSQQAVITFPKQQETSMLFSCVHFVNT